MSINFQQKTRQQNNLKSLWELEKYLRIPHPRKFQQITVRSLKMLFVCSYKVGQSDRGRTDMFVLKRERNKRQFGRKRD